MFNLTQIESKIKDYFSTNNEYLVDESKLDEEISNQHVEFTVARSALDAISTINWNKKAEVVSFWQSKGMRIPLSAKGNPSIADKVLQRNLSVLAVSEYRNFQHQKSLLSSLSSRVKDLKPLISQSPEPEQCVFAIFK